MALTRPQARDEYIIGSVGAFLTRNMKVDYDAEVLTLPYPRPLTIGIGKPDDKSKILKVPTVLVDTITGSEKNRCIEIGTNTMYRHLNVILYCFPSTANGNPSVQAADLLKAYMRDAFGTQYMRLVDYVNGSEDNPIFCGDVAELTNVGDPMDRKAATSLAEEAHRFDLHISLRYPVLESGAT